MRVDSVAFAVTYRCDLVCAHCCTHSGPRREPLCLSAEHMCSLVDELRLLGPVREVHFTGGEPTLCPDQVLRAIRHCKNLGIDTCVVTNAAWASTDAAAARTVGAYARSGLAEFGISFSTYHRFFLSTAHYFRAARAALAQGIRVHFLVRARSKQEAEASSAGLRAALAAEIPLDTQAVAFSADVLVPAGRAAGLPVAAFEHTSLSAVPKGGCGSLLNPIVATVEGDLMACCGAVYYGCEDLRLGHLSDGGMGGLAQQIRAARRDLVLRWIHATGPWKVLQTINPARYKHGSYIAGASICQGCKLLFFDADNRAQLYDYVEQRGVELLFGECLGAFAPRDAGLLEESA